MQQGQRIRGEYLNFARETEGEGTDEATAETRCPVFRGEGISAGVMGIGAGDGIASVASDVEEGEEKEEEEEEEEGSMDELSVTLFSLSFAPLCKEDWIEELVEEV